MGETTSIFDHFSDRTNEDIEGRGGYIFENRVKNNGSARGDIYIEIAELNSDFSLKTSLCRKSIEIDSGVCAKMGYGPDVCEIESVPDCGLYTICGVAGRAPGTYYFGIKTWGEDEDEPAFTEHSTKPEKVKVVTVHVIPKLTCGSDPKPEHYATGCDLLLAYDADDDGKISNDEYGQARQDNFNGVITDKEMLLVVEAWRASSINDLCPGCYSNPNGDITKVEISQTLPEGGTLDWTVKNEATIKVYFKNIGDKPSTFRIWTTDEDDKTLCDVTTDDEIPADGEKYSVECGSFTPGEVETKTLTVHIEEG